MYNAVLLLLVVGFVFQSTMGMCPPMPHGKDWRNSLRTVVNAKGVLHQHSARNFLVAAALLAATTTTTTTCPLPAYAALTKQDFVDIMKASEERMIGNIKASEECTVVNLEASIKESEASIQASIKESEERMMVKFDERANRYAWVLLTWMATSWLVIHKVDDTLASSDDNVDRWIASFSSSSSEETKPSKRKRTRSVNRGQRRRTK